MAKTVKKTEVESEVPEMVSGVEESLKPLELSVFNQLSVSGEELHVVVDKLNEVIKYLNK